MPCSCHWTIFQERMFQNITLASWCCNKTLYFDNMLSKLSYESTHLWTHPTSTKLHSQVSGKKSLTNCWSISSDPDTASAWDTNSKLSAVRVNNLYTSTNNTLLSTQQIKETTITIWTTCIAIFVYRWPDKQTYQNWQKYVSKVMLHVKWFWLDYCVW